MSRKIFSAAVLSLLVLSLVSGAAAADVSVDIRESEGDDLDDFDLEVTGETELERENIDRADLDLNEGEYDLEISKNGYDTIERTVFVEDGEDSSYLFTMLRTDEDDEGEIIVSNLQAPESVCEEESFSATVDVENTGEDDRVVSISGSGFGQILSGNSFVVEAGGSKKYRFIFTGTGEKGTEDFRITAGSRGESDSVKGSIDITECRTPGDASDVSNIDLQLFPLGGKEKAFVGEVVRVKGFADGSRGKVSLDLEIDGEKIGEASTDPGGYFQTYFRPEKAGDLTVTVSAPETSFSRELTVEPSPSVGNMRAPEEVFSGEEMQICGSINSAITPKVVLLENGEVIESRLGKGNVCFDITAPASGEYDYEMRVLTYGKGESARLQVNVLEQGPEAESFPGQVAMVETEPGVLKVSLYNTNNESRNYTARLQNFDESWVSESKKEVSLGKGDRETVYFYMSPERSGNFRSVLEVESEGDIIYSDEVEVFSADTRRDRDRRTFGEIYLRLLMFFA
jgi:hypothetical protein